MNSLPLENVPQKRPTKKVSFFRDVIETLLLALVLFIAINLVSARVKVEGFSMQPTLDHQQFVLVSRLTPRFIPLQRGDIVVFRPPMYPHATWLETLIGLPGVHSEFEDYIKRVIGLPGETVTVRDGQVWINGTWLNEPYVAEPPRYEGRWEVPEGYVFVLGDNRNNSSDSHSWGVLPIENILGKAILVYWPFSAWKVLDSGPVVQAAP
ncbi:MAG: signal peptidase I [Anaerolineales bacterium]|nr:signal peptidase I [Anaerolineales bacterium]